MRGAESVSQYRPITEAETFRIEYWDLEEAKGSSPAATDRHGGPRPRGCHK